MNNMMVKCGIANDCINESLIYYSKLEKHRKKIIQNLLSLRKITDKQLNDLKMTYKDFARHFFSKKTIKCMKSFCKPNPTDYKKTKKNIDEMKIKIKASKTKFRLMGEKKNYVILMDVTLAILVHFCKNYQRFFIK
jgi:predicted metal-dependent HD superfamily phosphohydrolase